MLNRAFHALPLVLVLVACEKKIATAPTGDPPPEPAAAAATPVMMKSRWVKIDMGGKAMIAYAYVDKMAGPSAKGGPVSDPPTKDEIEELVKKPPATLRDPESFGAKALDDATVKLLGLPAEPGWMAGASDFK